MVQTQYPLKQTKTRYGLMSYFADDPTIGHSLEVYGEYCHPEIEMILSMVDKDCVYIDIGANIGTHSVSIAPHVQTVLSFEPNSDNLAVLEVNCKSFNNITVSPKALSDAKAFGYTEFDYGKTVFIEREGSAQRCKTLDQYEFPRVDFVKIDTEGYELRILQGAGAMLTHRKPSLLLEMQDTATYSAIYDYLKIFDYYMYWMPVATFNPNNFKQESNNVFGNQHGVINWICSPKQLNTVLQPVVDRDDTVERMNWRIQNNVGHDFKHGE